ncbi:hypothetical protein FSP39_023781 [Pinctada imbricata]|uniref:Uncharacterized protein n=1 Tax=Pinctada imbricata TaxID=66713 RepID=A0AA88XK73_PINIB|nr:hypothetical protein FSP39_023781 [Pinctada imbricata]
MPKDARVASAGLSNKRVLTNELKKILTIISTALTIEHYVEHRRTPSKLEVVAPTVKPQNTQCKYTKQTSTERDAYGTRNVNAQHRNIKHKGLQINQWGQWATGADLGRSSATEIAEGQIHVAQSVTPRYDNRRMTPRNRTSVVDPTAQRTTRHFKTLPSFTDHQHKEVCGKSSYKNAFYTTLITALVVLSCICLALAAYFTRKRLRRLRYIDDVLSINNPKFTDYLSRIYPSELEVKETAETNNSASYLDIMLSSDKDGHMNTSLYDKRDDFNFSITNFPSLSSNIPSSPAYGVFIS